MVKPLPVDLKQLAGKAPLAEIPLDHLFGMARAFAYGAKKYERGNYLRCTNEPMHTYVGAALRHLAEVLANGADDVDGESGLPHIDHAIASLVMLRGILQEQGEIARDPGPGNEPVKVM